MTPAFKAIIVILVIVALIVLACYIKLPPHGD